MIKQLQTTNGVRKMHKIFAINKVSLVIHSIDEGNLFIFVPLKSSLTRPLTSPRFSGKLSNFEHLERSRYLSNFKLLMALGRHIGFLQSLRVNKLSKACVISN